MVEIRFASMLFPLPGGPINKMLCPPETATSIALLANSCPKISEKSNIPVFSQSMSPLNVFLSAGGICVPPRRCSTSFFKFSAGYTVIPSTTLASAVFSLGT